MKCSFARHALLVLVLLQSLIASAAETGVPPSASSAKGSLVFEAEQSTAVEGFLFTTVEIPFRVKNTGKRPVRIDSIIPRRGAGKGSAIPEVLAPGASGRIIVRRQVTTLGMNQYAFRVATDDSPTANYPLRASIMGVSAYTPDLPSISFDVVRFGHSVAQRVTVSSYEATVLDVKAILEAPPWLSVKGVPRAESESSQDLVIEARIKPDAPKGLLKGAIHLLTSVAGQPDLVIPVQARVFDTVSVSPLPATMKPAYVGEMRKVDIEFRALDGKALALESVTEPSGALRLQPSSCGPNCVKVGVEFRANKVGEFGGEITARFTGREEAMKVGWDILVVANETALRDLGTLGGEPEEAGDSAGRSKP